MKINLHDRTPRRTTSTFIKSLFFISGILLYVMCVLFAYCIFTYTNEILIGIAFIILSPLIAFCFIRNLNRMTHSYAEFDGESVTVTNLFFFGKHEKIIYRSTICHYEFILAYSHKCPGRKIPLSGMEYIVFRDKNNKCLFKIMKTPEALEWTDALMRK